MQSKTVVREPDDGRGIKKGLQLYVTDWIAEWSKSHKAFV